MSNKRIGGLRLWWLEAFLAVVDRRSFSSAAASLGCNQSTATRAISDLELWLGSQLFSCRAPLKISDEGEAFYKVAQEVVELLRASRSPQAIDIVTVPKP